MRVDAHVTKRTVAVVLKERISSRVSLDTRACCVIFVGLKLFLVRNSIARRREHVTHVDIHETVVIVVTPADGHSRRDVFDSRLPGNVGESHLAVRVAIIAIQIIAAKIVSDIEIGITVVVVIFPRRRKREPVVVCVKSHGSRDVAEGKFSVILHHEVAGAVIRVVIRHRIGKNISRRRLAAGIVSANK